MVVCWSIGPTSAGEITRDAFDKLDRYLVENVNFDDPGWNWATLKSKRDANQLPEELKEPAEVFVYLGGFESCDQKALDYMRLVESATGAATGLPTRQVDRCIRSFLIDAIRRCNPMLVASLSEDDKQLLSRLENKIYP